MWKWITIVVLAACLAGCSNKTAADYQQQAQAALHGRDPAKAIRLVDEALGRDSVRQDAAMAWRLEQIRLEALAQEAKGADVKAGLERLASAYPTQVNGSLYRVLADKVKSAGDTAGAVDILTAGDQRFPAEHDSFVAAIDELKKAGDLDPAQVEKLRSLGYL